ncbi:MAG: zinc metallopeptidase [Clostridia bacterium]|nr:zinc metallopeptidase [Clostridia bacterium]
MLYGIDIYYILLVIPAVVIALIAQVKVKSTYKKYSKVLNSRGVTGAMAAKAILDYYGITDVSIQGIAGSLTDNFNPTSKVISLSEGVFNNSTVAAVGIACHEAGHAAQHADNYKPIMIRNSIIPVCNIGSTLGLPLAIIGFFLCQYSQIFEFLIYVGLALYAFVFLFHLVTLPTEIDASRRAIKVIEETGLLQQDEIGGAKKVLFAAAMTYVASMLVALANLLRFVIRFTGNRRR